MTDETLPAQMPEPLLNPQMNFNLALDVALGVDEQNILDAYDLQHHELEWVKSTAVFKANLQKVREELSERGASFRLKAQAQAEVLLAESFRLATDPHAPMSVRAEMIRNNVRWAGFDQPNPKGAGGDADGGFHITINLGNNEQGEARVINGTNDGE